jgi:hypothetical protein
MKNILVLLLLFAFAGCTYNSEPVTMVDYLFEGTGNITHLEINYYTFEYVSLPFRFVQFVPADFQYNVKCSSINPVTLTIFNNGILIFKETNTEIRF